MNLDFAYGVLPDREWRTLPSGVRVLQDAEGPILQLSHRDRCGGSDRPRNGPRGPNRGRGEERSPLLW